MPITVSVVLLGFVKCLMIVQYFMEVRTAPRRQKATTDAGSSSCVGDFGDLPVLTAAP